MGGNPPHLYCTLEATTVKLIYQTDNIPETFSVFLCWPSAPFLLSSPLEQKNTMKHIST